MTNTDKAPKIRSGVWSRVSRSAGDNTGLYAAVKSAMDFRSPIYAAMLDAERRR